MDRKSLAQIIRKAREEQGLTLKQLSEKSGFTVRAIQYWESSAKNISLENADRLLKALGTEIIIGGKLTVLQSYTVEKLVEE